MVKKKNMVDKNIQSLLRAKYNPDGSVMRKAQLRMVEMLAFVDKVCKDNNLSYWLDSGTLIGAARHGGFIPWDEDTDICMPRKDMLKFKEIMLNGNVSDEFVLQCHETDSEYYGFWPVLRDLKSEYIQDSVVHNKRKYRGLQVDIFPVEDNIRPGAFKFCEKYVKCFILYPLMGAKSLGWLRPFIPVSHYLLDKLIIPALRWYSSFFRPNDYLHMSYGCAFYSKRYIKDVYPLGEIIFEGKSLRAPCNVSSYLQTIYGSWDKLPSEDKIITHKVEIKFKE